MFLWYIGMSVLIVVNVFRSSGVDYRLVAGGALLPLLVDLPVGHRAFGHTLLFPVALLAVVMIGTIGRSRLLRRRLLCLPIGVFCGLVLSGAFASGAPFFWPFFGGFADDPLLPVWWVVLLEELAGLVACWWIVGQFDLYLPEPRTEFLRTGRLQESVPPAE
jgi:membrane-bound metal-dependent hydrolase YbcI (DUF457 family)